MTHERKGLSRRAILQGFGAGAAAFAVVPSHVVAGSDGTPPSEQVNIAAIGVGERGNVDIPQVARADGARIVALCDVDHRLDSTVRMFEKFPDARRFVDYRRMYDMMESDIDAVVIATPDHAHFHPAMSALQLEKHVYLEKPLAHTIHEVRRLVAESRKHDVVTQMGNQGHSTRGTALARDWIRDGAIGEVREAWTWISGGAGTEAYRKTPAKGPIPSSLHWQLWLNRAPYEAFRPKFHPNDWRGWRHFGEGQVGDECCHRLDLMYSALQPDLSATVEVDVGQEWPVEESYPFDQQVTWRFPRGEGDEPLRVRLFVGRKPPRPEALAEDRSFYDSGGILVGDKGALMHGTHGEDPQILPEERMREVGKPPKRSPRIKGDHWTSWVQACRGEGRALSDFEYAGGLTEMVLLAELALRSEDGRIEWDPEAMKTDDPAANHCIKPPEARRGWRI